MSTRFRYVLVFSLICFALILFASCGYSDDAEDQGFGINPVTGAIGKSQWGMTYEELLSAEGFSEDEFDENQMTDEGTGYFITKPVITEYGMARLQYFIRDISGEGVGRLDSVYYLFGFDGATVNESHTDELRTKLTEALGEPVKELMPLYGDEGVPLAEDMQFWASEKNLSTELNYEQKLELRSDMNLKNNSDLSDDEFYEYSFKRYRLWQVSIHNDDINVNGYYTVFVNLLNRE